MPYDPDQYLGAAHHYAVGRPAYSAQLVQTLSGELGLDGHGRLLDAGCGPGVLAVELAGLFDEVIGLDPDAGMLAEAALRAERRGVINVSWVHSVAEDLPRLDLGTFRAVTFGQSFHRTQREEVAEAVFDLLEPGGAMVCVVHTVEGRPAPANPGHPVIPHDEIQALVKSYLGPRLRSGRGFVVLPPDRFEDALRRTRFGEPRFVFAPGRPDIVRDTDSVVSGYFSMSWSAPHLFGDLCDAFEADLRALLERHAPDGLFWDWPGDTELIIAEKPADR